MKRDFLKNLGIEDKDIIDKILDENSSDIGRAKGELDTYKNRVTELQGQLADKDKEITSLQSKTGNVDELNNKIAQLEADKTNLTNELNTKVTQIQKTHAIENGVREAKAKSVKAVVAHLDMEKITFENGELSGLTEQLDALKNAEDTGFLFGEVKISGANPSNPNHNPNDPAPTGKTFAEAVASAFSAKQN